MTRKCAWCGRCLGLCAPLEDKSVTHGMCRRCSRCVFPFARAEDFPEVVPVSADAPSSHKGPRRPFFSAARH
jgi:hypothetical protein